MLTKSNPIKMPEIIEQQKTVAKPPKMPKKYGIPNFKPRQQDEAQGPVVEPENIYHEV